MAANERQSASAQLAASMFGEISMLARAITAMIDGTDDPDAARYVRNRAALGTPNAALDAFAEQREREIMRARNHTPIATDAHADTRAIREKMYEGLPAWRPNA